VQPVNAPLRATFSLHANGGSNLHGIVMEGSTTIPGLNFVWGDVTVSDNYICHP
jgi:hypothetical protein